MTKHLDYGFNVALFFVLAGLDILPFYLLFGNTYLLWFATAVVGMPHIIIGSFVYLARDTKKIIFVARL